MKISIQEKTNRYCPQTLFLYGTNKEDGSPDFGLFCWFSYCWDGELCIMACIGGEKLTKDNIRREGMFSANLVTEDILPLADYLGNKEGYAADKMSVDIAISRGVVLDVPVLDKSPITYELQVKQIIPMDDGDVMICTIQNMLVDESLPGQFPNTPLPVEIAKPVITTGSTYFKVGEPIALWGQPKDTI